MIIIKTFKYELSTGNPVYKEYLVTNGIKAAMVIINSERMDNDLVKYSPIRIYDIVDTDEN